MAGVLIVEDHLLVACSLARMVRHTPSPDPSGWEVVVAHTASTARTALGRENFAVSAAILDVKLPDGDGLELLAEFRERLADARVLVLTGHHDEAELSRRAFMLDASFVAKPVDPDVIRRILVGANTRRLVDEDRVCFVVEAWIRRYHLTPRQAQLLATTVSSQTPSSFRDEAGISLGRYKELVRALLAKCGRHDLDRVIIDVQREALRRGDTHNPSLGTG